MPEKASMIDYASRELRVMDDKKMPGNQVSEEAEGPLSVLTPPDQWQEKRETGQIGSARDSRTNGKTTSQMLYHNLL